MRRFSKSIWIIATLGVLIRAVAYLQNRSLYLDEILLALNVMQRSFGELATPPLGLHQMAPIGFLYLSKAVVILLGCSEMALRLVPFAAGLAGLAVFPFVAEKCLRREAIPYAMTFCALSFGLIYYSSEFKQYSLDGLASMLLCLVGFSILQQTKKSRPIILVIQLLTIMFACLASFSSFFVSLSVLIVLVSNTWTSKQWEKLLLICLVGCCMALCFCVTFETSFRTIDPGGRASFLSDWTRAHAFMPVAIPGDGRFLWLATKPSAPLLMVHPSPEMQGLLAFVWIVGAASLFRRSRQNLALLLLPAAFALIASSFEIYPWSGRFLVFLAPMVCLFLGEGTLLLFNSLRKKTPIVATMLCTLILLSLVGINAYDIAFLRSKEDSRTVFQYIQGSGSPFDTMYLYDHCVHHFKYYSKSIDFGDCATDTGYNSEPEFFHQHFPGQRVWVVYSKYASGARIGTELRKHFRVIDSISQRGMEGVLIDCSTYN